MRKHVVWIIIVVILLLYAFLSAVTGITKEAKAFDLGHRTKKIALINVYDEIYDSTGVLRLLNKYSDMKSVKAIVIRINSPGGGPGASQEIYRQIIKTKEKGIKIIVSMGDVSASGAYYIALPADIIYANPATLTGSIGVYLNFMTAEKLFDKIGLNFFTIKSGEFKDSGSVSRKPTKREIELLENVIMDVYGQFVDDVVESRHMQIAKALDIINEDPDKQKADVEKRLRKDIADGRIITGRKAKALGLIDELGNIDDAIEAAASLVGIEGRPNVISEKTKMTFMEWLNSKTGILGLKEKPGPVVKYLMQ